MVGRKSSQMWLPLIPIRLTGRRHVRVMCSGKYCYFPGRLMDFHVYANVYSPGNISRWNGLRVRRIVLIGRKWCLITFWNGNCVDKLSTWLIATEFIENISLTGDSPCRYCCPGMATASIIILIPKRSRGTTFANPPKIVPIELLKASRSE